MQKPFSITLDVSNRLINNTFEVNNNDINTVQLLVSLKDENEPFDLTGKTIKLAVKKPDGTTVFQDGTLTDPINGLGEFILRRQAYLVPGKHEAELMISEGNSATLVTSKFNYSSTKAILNDETIESTNEFPAIQQALIAGEILKDIDVPVFFESAKTAIGAADNANSKAVYAETQGTYAKQQADKAALRLNELNGVESMTAGSYAGEPVELTSPPALIDVQSINAVEIQKTSITIEWPMSLSDSFDSYKIYKDNVLIATLPYTQRSFKITDLTPYKDYTIKVAVADEAGKVTTGTTKVIKSKGYFLEMNGFPEVYLMLPSLTVTEFVMECKINKPETAVKKFIFDGRLPLSLGEISTANNVENYGAYFPKVFVNDIQVVNNTKWFDTGVPITLKWQKPTGASTGTMKVFSNYLGKEQVAGEIYSIKAYNGAALLAHYDFRTGTYNDLSGNNNQLAYTSGRFR